MPTNLPGPGKDRQRRPVRQLHCGTDRGDRGAAFASPSLVRLEDAINVSDHRRRRGIAVVRGLLQSAEHDRVDIGRDVRVVLARRCGLVEEVVREHLLRFTAERRLPGQQLIQDAAHRVEITAGVGGCLLYLLRRRIPDGEKPGDDIGLSAGTAGMAGQAEIHELDPTCRHHHHVGGLDVTVDQAQRHGSTPVHPAAAGSAPRPSRSSPADFGTSRRPTSTPGRTPSRGKASGFR